MAVGVAAMLKVPAEKIAAQKGISMAEVAAATSANAEKLFKI